jgi:hypothetical protein
MAVSPSPTLLHWYSYHPHPSSRWLAQPRASQSIGRCRKRRNKSWRREHPDRRGGGALVRIGARGEEISQHDLDGVASGAPDPRPRTAWRGRWSPAASPGREVALAVSCYRRAAAKIYSGLET